MTKATEKNCSVLIFVQITAINCDVPFLEIKDQYCNDFDRFLTWMFARKNLM